MRKCFEMIVKYMGEHGTRFLRDSQPTAFEKQEDGKIKVTFENTMFGNTLKKPLTRRESFCRQRRKPANCWT